MQILKLSIIVLIMAGCLPKNHDYVKVDDTLIELEYKRERTRGSAIRNYSIANGKEYFFDTLTLTNCWCNIISDTLEIQIGYFSESLEAVRFKVSEGKYTSETIFYSDYGEFGGDHEMYIPTDTSSLTLNKLSFQTNDSLLGVFYLKSKLITYQDWDRQISFEGKFQCVIEEKWK